MRSQAQSSVTKLQYDTEGKVVGTLTKSSWGPWVLSLEPDYEFIVTPETGRVRIWGGKDFKLIELAK